MKAALDKNILVISDLHLGEDLRNGAPGMSYLRHVVRLERELEQFLAHYTCTRTDGRPWRLVVNGDMVDFMSIMILPEGQALGEASVEDRHYGLGYTELQSTAKLTRVFERHPGVFRALAEFVKVGNELVIVVGNHDVEFHYAAVQRCFADGLVALAGVGGTEAELPFRTSLSFCPWFYYKKDLVYVEHGHQYDEYCSFDYQLHPVETKGSIALSIAHGCMRYFSNLVPSLDPHCGETWGFADYIKWGWAHGVRGLARLVYLYGLLVLKLVQIWAGLTNRASSQARGVRHRRELKDLAQRYELAAEKLEALDRLHVDPVIKRLFGIFSTMFFDRILVGFALAVALVVGLSTARGWHKLPMAGGILALGFVVNWVLSRNRLMASPAALRRAPAAILRIMRAPFIVFGHSHYTERVQLEGGGVYFNTGTWADTSGRDLFPHLIISTAPEGSDELPTAELWSWQNGGSARL